MKRIPLLSAHHDQNERHWFRSQKEGSQSQLWLELWTKKSGVPIKAIKPAKTGPNSHARRLPLPAYGCWAQQVQNLTWSRRKRACGLSRSRTWRSVARSWRISFNAIQACFQRCIIHSAASAVPLRFFPSRGGRNSKFGVSSFASSGRRFLARHMKPATQGRKEEKQRTGWIEGSGGSERLGLKRAVKQNDLITVGNFSQDNKLR